MEATALETRLSAHTVCDGYSFCREVCYVIVTNISTPIGGPGKIVKIDETHIARRKYNRGQPLRNEVQHLWVFGGIERGSKKCFIVRVHSRAKEKLILLIKQLNISYCLAPKL